MKTIDLISLISLISKEDLQIPRKEQVAILSFLILLIRLLNLVLPRVYDLVVFQNGGCIPQV